MPLIRRLPKRGFNNARFRTEYVPINVGQLEAVQAEVIDPVVLEKAGLVKKILAGVKILGGGDLKRSVTVRAHKFSTSARRKIEAAGGKVEVIS